MNVCSLSYPACSAHALCYIVICVLSDIKMDLQEVGGGRGDWMELAQDRDGWRSLGTVRNFRVP